MSPSEDFLEYMKQVNPKVEEKLAGGFASNFRDNMLNNKGAVYKLSQDSFDSFLKTASANAQGPSIAPSFDFLQADIHIKDEMMKFAGMIVHDTSPEGIEQFLKEFMYNELSFFPDKITVTVNIIPLDNTPTNNGTGQMDVNIFNASGTVDLLYANTLIQLPFVMRDKELLPFDTIQMGSENAVYTRENLRNILFNLKNMMEKKTQTGANNTNVSSYVGVDKPIGNLTDGGFMQDMLRIQALLASNMTPAYNYAYSAEHVDELLEKTAAITEVNIDYKKLEQELVKEYKGAAEKLASAEYDEPADKILEKKAFLQSLEHTIQANVDILKNGDFFIFTEKHDSTICKTQAVVFKTLANIRGISLNQKMIVTSDGRFTILQPGERFMFNLDTTATTDVAPFKITERSSESLNPGYTYTAEVGGTYLLPFSVTKVRTGSERTPFNLHQGFFYYCVDLNDQQFIMMPTKHISDNQMILKSKMQVLEEVAEHEQPKNLTMYNVILKDKVPILCVSESTKFIQLNPGKIHFMSSPKEEMWLFDNNIKLAAFKDQVRINVTSRDVGQTMFSLEANWFDRRRQMDRVVSMDNLDEVKLKGVLRTMGFEYTKISEIVYRADREGAAVYELTPGTTPWMVKPELSAGMSAANTVDTLKQSFFNSDNAKKAVVGILGAAGGALLAGSNLGDWETIHALKSTADESEALAQKLEKVAMVKESKEFVKLAGLMVLKNRLDNLVLNALDGKEYEGTEVLADLYAIDPMLEKTARELIDLKLHQAFFKNEMLSPNVINATLRQLDGLHKYALHFSKEAEAPPIVKGKAATALDVAAGTAPLTMLAEPAIKKITG